MSERITVMFDDDVVKKLRLIQAKMIQTETTSVSFSRVINEILKKGLK
ncbi:MAG TPA: hypothetical protein VLD64_03495 [Nitrosarchaeum sp.]|jgi:hypothetical protein|nr:hypothetical protein [Nitrosarchaeum sp.]